MSDFEPQLCTAFDGFHVLASGPVADVAIAVRRAQDAGAAGPLLTFADATGKVIDLDLRGSDADIVARHTPEEPRGRGRPKLGVVAREITLLPRHWDWLAEQPGGASVTLRKLIDEARRATAPAQQARAAKDAAYRFMAALAGDLPRYEDAIRALFAGDAAGLAHLMADWPEDVRGYALRLAG